MTQETTVNVTEEKVQGPFEGKWGEFYKVVWTTDAGEEYSRILKKDEEAPELTGLVWFAYNEAGKYKNVIEYQATDEGAAPVKVTKPKATTKPTKSTTAATGKSSTAPTVASGAVTRTLDNKGPEEGMITKWALDAAVAKYGPEFTQEDVQEMVLWAIKVKNYVKANNS